MSFCIYLTHIQLLITFLYLLDVLAIILYLRLGKLIAKNDNLTNTVKKNHFGKDIYVLSKEELRNWEHRKLGP